MKEKSIEEILAFLTTHQFTDKWDNGKFRFRRLYWSDLRQEWNAPIEDEVGNGYDFPASTPADALKNLYKSSLTEDWLKTLPLSSEEEEPDPPEYEVKEDWLEPRLEKQAN